MPAANRVFSRTAIVSTIRLLSRSIGHGQSSFVIAEAGVNHNGSIDLAQQLIDVAAEAGADAVKFQAFRADRLAAAGAPKVRYQAQAGDPDESQLQMLRRLELSENDFTALIAHATSRHIPLLSSVFDEERADFLERNDAPAFKIPSGELTNLPLLAHVARKGKPVIISTGMATLDEVRDAVNICASAGNRDVVLLHCVSSYPTEPADANLNAIATLRREFELPVGYSDHTQGTAVALAAVALGACVVEKHVTLSATLPGPDHAASLEPAQLKELVRAIRTVEQALGDGIKRPTADELDTAAVVRRSLVAALDIPAGTLVRPELIVLRRPGTGLAPALRSQVLGRKAKRDITAGELLSFEMLA